MSWLRIPLLLVALGLIVQCALIAAAAGFAVRAEAITVDRSGNDELAATWHEPLRYLALATRLDPLQGDYPEARGELARLLADRVPALQASQLELARRSYAVGLERSPQDGILWARQASLAMVLGDYEGASLALARAVEFGAFEPPAHRIIVADAFPHWRQLDAAARQSVLTMAGNSLLQASQGGSREARLMVERLGVMQMTCHHLARRGTLPDSCRDRIGARGVD